MLEAVKGARVNVTFAGRTVEAEVILASFNHQSLMLRFEAVLGGFAGTMPVLWDGHCYRDIMHSEEVQLEWLP